MILPHYMNLTLCGEAHISLGGLFCCFSRPRRRARVQAADLMVMNLLRKNTALDLVAADDIDVWVLDRTARFLSVDGPLAELLGVANTARHLRDIPGALLPPINHLYRAAMLGRKKEIALKIADDVFHIEAYPAVGASRVVECVMLVARPLSIAEVGGRAPDAEQRILRALRRSLSTSPSSSNDSSCERARGSTSRGRRTKTRGRTARAAGATAPPASVPAAASAAAGAYTDV